MTPLFVASWFHGCDFPESWIGSGRRVGLACVTEECEESVKSQVEEGFLEPLCQVNRRDTSVWDCLRIEGLAQLLENGHLKQETVNK